MSDARRCDICGNYYEVKQGEKDGFALFYTYNNGGMRGYDRVEDCCPDCIKAFEKVIEERKQIRIVAK